jgi:hypothetical protein
MTVQRQGTGASSDRAKHWHSIGWVRCHREVRRPPASDYLSCYLILIDMVRGR